MKKSKLCSIFLALKLPLCRVKTDFAQEHGIAQEEAAKKPSFSPTINVSPSLVKVEELWLMASTVLCGVAGLIVGEKLGFFKASSWAMPCSWAKSVFTLHNGSFRAKKIEHNLNSFITFFSLWKLTYARIHTLRSSSDLQGEKWHKNESTNWL